VVLVGAVALTVVGGLGGVTGALGRAFGGLVDRVTATAEPSATPLLALDAPRLDAPAQPYTSEPTVTLSGSLAPGTIRDPAARLRISDTLPDQAAKVVKEVALPPTATFTIPGIRLADGQNDFTATVVSGDVESAPSAVVTYVLDVSAPKVTISSPKDGAIVNGDVVKVTGKTQPQSTILARNEANGASGTATAADDGTFTVTIAIVGGTNGITVTATDPAGNHGSAVVGVQRGSGKLTADLSASSYRLSARTLPKAWSVRVVVHDPDGAPLEGAMVLFTISVPGIPQIVPSEVPTGANGVASFQTTIPKGATTGTGPIAAQVTTDTYGTVTVRTVLTITK
jgi:hypothetical protein